MFIEIQPYENETLSVRFKAGREDFSKILQAIKKYPTELGFRLNAFGLFLLIVTLVIFY